MNWWPIRKKERLAEDATNADIIAMAEVISKLQSELNRYKEQCNTHYKTILDLRKQIAGEAGIQGVNYEDLPWIVRPIKYIIESDERWVRIIANHDVGRTISFNREFDKSKSNYNWVSEGQALITLRYDNVATSLSKPETIQSPVSGIFHFRNNKLIKAGDEICRIEIFPETLKQQTLEALEREAIKQAVLQKERKKMIERETLDELISEGLVFNVITTKDGNRMSIPNDVANAVWNRDGGRCCICGSRSELEFDHIIPLSKGGATTFRNLQLLCHNCNLRKSDKI